MINYSFLLKGRRSTDNGVTWTSSGVIQGSLTPAWNGSEPGPLMFAYPTLVALPGRSRIKSIEYLLQVSKHPNLT
jgi:hypothetical protein